MNGEREQFFVTLYSGPDGRVNFERLWFSRLSATILEPRFTQDEYLKMGEKTLRLLRAHWDRLNGISDADFLASFAPAPPKSTSSQEQMPSPLVSG